jgi:hypothetical protein
MSNEVGHTWASWLEEQADATDRSAPPEMRYFTITTPVARRIASQLRRLRADAYIQCRLDERPGSYGWIYDAKPTTAILAAFRDSWIAHTYDESVEAMSIESVLREVIREAAKKLRTRMNWPANRSGRAGAFDAGYDAGVRAAIKTLYEIADDQDYPTPEAQS